MKPSSVKVQALFFLLLLGGHEAVRIHDDANLAQLALAGSGDFNEEPNEWEMKYREMNNKCKASNGQCGEGCAWRPLTMDMSKSSSCRVSDKHLLQENRAENVKMMAGVMEAKSAKFAAKCQGYFSEMNPWCKRRVQQMFNVLRFLTVALEKDKSPEGSAEREVLKEVFESSFSNMIKAFGDDGLLVQKLQKLALSSKTMNQYPEGTVKRIMDLTTKLTSKDKAEHDEAKEMIERADAFEGISDEDSDESEKLESTDAEEEGDAEEVQEEMTEQLGQLVPFSDAPASSALEVVSSSKIDSTTVAASLLAVVAVGATLFLVAAISQAVVVALITYAFLSAFGCSTYYVGAYAGANKQSEPQKDEKEENAVETKAEVAETKMSKSAVIKNSLKCFGKFAILPFKLVYYLGKWVVKGIRKLTSKKTNSTKSE